MIDMTDTIIPKSDQLNADDLIGRTLTIKITNVSRCREAEQPIAINFEGDNNKPYKPGKSMRRVLVNVWGPDGAAYVGRSLTLYRDDEVVFGGLKVGGIRISNMSGITKNVTMALTATRASRKPFTVHPLIEAPDIVVQAERAAQGGVASYQQFWKTLTKEQRTLLLPKHEAFKATAIAVDAPPTDDEDAFAVTPPIDNAPEHEAARPNSLPFRSQSKLNAWSANSNCGSASTRVASKPEK